MNTVIQCDPELLRPIVEAVLAEALARLEADRARFSDKMAYGEPEAARLLSLRVHQLRDERRRGRIEASQGPGRLILYTPAQLLAYLTSRPYTPNGDGSTALDAGRVKVAASANGTARRKRQSAKD